MRTDSEVCNMIKNIFINEQSLYKKLVRSNASLIGGSIVDIIHSREEHINDYDIYFPSTIDFNDFVNSSIRKLSKVTEYGSEYYTYTHDVKNTLKYSRNVQYINPQVMSSTENSIVSDIDISLCKVSYSFSDDKLTYHGVSREHNEQKIARISGTVNPKKSIASLLRLIKYEKKGFSYDIRDILYLIMIIGHSEIDIKESLTLCGSIVDMTSSEKSDVYNALKSRSTINTINKIFHKDKDLDRMYSEYKRLQSILFESKEMS